MSEHRRKPPKASEGGRAAARRGAQPPGRRAAPRDTSGSAAGPYGEEAPYMGRAAARRAQKSGGRRRAGAAGAGAAGAAGAGYGGHGGGGGHRGGGYGGDYGGDYGDDPGKGRFIDYPRAGRYGASRWIPSWKLVGGSALGSMALLIGAAGIGLAIVGVPDPNDAATAQKNVYYWDNNKPMVVAGGGDVNRQIVPLSKIPQHMQDAVISAENASFETDSGVDPMGILRAVFNMATGGTTQSGSTITQQYVKNAMLSQDQTLSRKVKELLISTKVGATVSKDEILKGYLNTAYYGRGAYGIQAASRAYFNKNSEKLTASESAFLSALLNGPNLYDPAGGVGEAATKDKNLARAKARWSWTLNREVAVGRMKKADRDEIGEKFPKVLPPRKATEKKGQIGYLTDLADGYVTNKGDITKEQLDRGGFHIYTTFNQKKVKEMESAVKTIYKRNMRPKERERDKHVQFGGASVKPKDGAIVAIYGGQDWTKHFTNNADVTGAQVGSTFKPFVLAAAMRDGVRDPKNPNPDQGRTDRKQVSPRSVYSGKNKLLIRDYAGKVWHNEKGEEWRQVNDGNESYGDINLREAMRVSANSPYVQLGMDVGTQTVKDAAVDAGLHEESLDGSTNSPSFALGTASPSAIRMAGAYATFAASGQQADPYSVRMVKKEDNVVYQHKKKTPQAFTSAVADNVTDVLKNVVDKGTGTSAQLPGRQVAGKTGTTDGNKSAWFVGYTPQLSTAVGMWRLNDDAAAKNRHFLKMFGTGGQKKIHGASFPAEIWATYMGRALTGVPPANFPTPVPIGDKIYGPGASPSPTPTPSDTPSASPSETPDQPSGTPSPTQGCGLFDPNCEENSGGQNGGTDGGTDGGTSSSPPPPNGGNGNGGGGGGFFGGSTGVPE
ncbi:transglycosylase domain-containing protein [Streptomyces meridianus]|uniref:Penicillin-binding protein n=1 Tax=Streptomyces meridianus TaxID=2938945 RepID=A0ABT0X7J5_9ACTN|nr:transglycosylase domain-containing protein [Streptomyces meridianus]MCM2578503.1 penicillin-binding protein [Streptomyces meridianus]